MTKQSLPFFIFFLLGLFACENDDRVLNDWTRSVTLTEEATDMQTFISQSGKRKARIEAPYMVKENRDTVSMTFPRSVHCDFYDDSLRIDSRLDARFGVYYENLNKVFLKDSVVVITQKGDTLTSPELWWDQNTQLFTTDKYAIYRGPDQQIMGGKGLEATQDLKRITFRATTGTVKAPAVQ
jgi:LPS export ABC transporter protein LptC